MYKVMKRDGKEVKFDLAKIGIAIRKAFDSVDRQYNQDIIDMLALKVTADYEKKIKDSLVTVEDIQDSVEAVLIAADYADVAKSYILYRKQREKIRNMQVAEEESVLMSREDAFNKIVTLTGGRAAEELIFKSITSGAANDIEQATRLARAMIDIKKIKNQGVKGII